MHTSIEVKPITFIGAKAGVVLVQHLCTTAQVVPAGARVMLVAGVALVGGQGQRVLNTFAKLVIARPGSAGGSTAFFHCGTQANFIERLF